MIASEDRNQIHPRNRQLKEIRRERERRREGGDHRFGLGVQEAAAAREFFCSPSLPPSLPDAHFISCGICTTQERRAGLALVRKWVTGHLRCPVNNVGPLLSGSSDILPAITRSWDRKPLSNRQAGRQTHSPRWHCSAPGRCRSPVRRASVVRLSVVRDIGPDQMSSPPLQPEPLVLRHLANLSRAYLAAPRPEMGKGEIQERYRRIEDVAVDRMICPMRFISDLPSSFLSSHPG